MVQYAVLADSPDQERLREAVGQFLHVLLGDHDVLQQNCWSHLVYLGENYLQSS